MAFCIDPPKPGQIVINDSGGSMQNAMKQAFYDEFEKRYGIKVVATSPVDLGKLRAMVQSKNVEWTVTEIGGQDALLAEQSGLLEPLDLKIIDLSRYPEHTQARKFVFPKGVYSTVMGYRTDVFKDGGPKSWAEFWDTKKFPGPRTLQNAPVDNLEFALLADGVPKDKLYPIDVNRAFKAMDRVRPSIRKFWDTGALSAQMLADKEVVLGSIWNGRLQSVAEKGAPLAIEWNEAMLQSQYWAPMKGAKNLENAQQFIDFACQPEIQAGVAKHIPYGPTNRQAFKSIPADLAARLPSSPENRQKAFVQNGKWWADNRPMISERWSQWLLQKG